MSVRIFGFMDNILVVGAGPAGSACAWRLATGGVPCVLADSASFPRSKPCGGVLSGRGEKILLSSGMVTGEELDDLTLRSHGTMTISSDFHPLRTFTGGTPPVRLVERTGFDAFLRRRALEAGARPMEDRFTGFQGGEAVFMSGSRVPFRRAVGADGASSRVRRSLPGVTFARPAPALTSLVALSPAAMGPFMEKGLQIFFFTGFTGYGWLFPRRDDLLAGIGSFDGSSSGMRTLMHKLMLHAGAGVSSPVSGALLPGSGQRVTPGSGAVLLAGDAAGLCDRVSGEGISHALESGIAAAEALLEGAETWNSECIRTVRQSSRYRVFLYGSLFRRLAMRSLAGSDRWYRKYWEIVCGGSGYGNLFR